ncbi:MAG TPA: DHA2 family efflux MFS transporter permease subunit [Burkholderiaceae bacterium]|nr:DHA2 family efflux MFS transporter permease subunit [Burkholderiaceae bacterium]
MTDAIPNSLAELAARHGPNYRWKVLATIMIGSIASVMSSTIVNVAVPDLIHQFAIGQERAQWVATAFMAAMTLSMLPTPWLLARFGYRHTYYGAVGLLMLGGLAGGLAPTYDVVLAMRALEGLAAGVLGVVPSIVIMRAFAPGTQGRAMGIFGFGVVLAPAVGPSIGGLLVEHFGWRSIFFVVLPFGAIALVLARRLLPIAAPGGARPNTDTPRLDWSGLWLAAFGVLGLLNGLVHLHDPSPVIATVLLLAGVVGLAAFAVRGLRVSGPLLDLRISRHRTFRMGAVVAFMYGMGLFGSTYLVPIFMQTALHFPPSQAGAALLPAGLVLAVTIPLGGHLSDRIAPYALVACGLVLLTASFVLMATVGTGTALWVLMTWAVVGRIGLGLVLPSLSLGAMRGLQPEEIAHGASGISFARQLGGAVGISVVGVVLEWRLRVEGAAGASPLVGFAETFWMVAGLCLLATLAALRMRQPRA